MLIRTKAAQNLNSGYYKLFCRRDGDEAIRLLQNNFMTQIFVFLPLMKNTYCSKFLLTQPGDFILSQETLCVE